MVFLDGAIYADNGDVFDPSSNASLTRFLPPFPDTAFVAVRPDNQLNRVFFVARSFLTGVLYLAAYNRTTTQLIGTEEVDLANDGGFCTSGLSARTELYRWGTDGVAFRTNGCHVVLLHSTLVQ